MSEAQTQLENPSVVAVLLLARGFLTENVIHMGEVGRDVTVFTGTPRCQFTQPKKKVAVSKDSTLEPVFKPLQFQGRQHAIVM